MLRLEFHFYAKTIEASWLPSILSRNRPDERLNVEKQFERVNVEKQIENKVFSQRFVGHHLKRRVCVYK